MDQVMRRVDIDTGEVTEGTRLELFMRHELDLEEVSRALTREAAIRSVMKIREVSREQAIKVFDGEKP